MVAVNLYARQVTRKSLLWRHFRLDHHHMIGKQADSAVTALLTSTFCNLCVPDVRISAQSWPMAPKPLAREAECMASGAGDVHSPTAIIG